MGSRADRVTASQETHSLGAGRTYGAGSRHEPALRHAPIAQALRVSPPCRKPRGRGGNGRHCGRSNTGAGGWKYLMELPPGNALPALFGQGGTLALQLSVIPVQLPAQGLTSMASLQTGKDQLL